MRGANPHGGAVVGLPKPAVGAAARPRRLSALTNSGKKRDMTGKQRSSMRRISIVRIMPPSPPALHTPAFVIRNMLIDFEQHGGSRVGHDNATLRNRRRF